MKKRIESVKQFEEEQEPLKAAKILIVDDENGIRMLIYDILTDNGYDVCAATCAEEALSKIKETVFDLLITDIKMPGMSGLELLPKVKMICPDIEVIVITGYHEPVQEEYCMAQGAADFIMKSLQFENLLSSVDRTLRGRL